MNKRNILPKVNIKLSQKRFDLAKKNLEKLQKEVAPFIKRRTLERHSTAGQWCESSTLSTCESTGEFIQNF